MINIKKAQNKEVGAIGENLACEFLKKRGYKIIARNYLKKCGEIDVIAQKVIDIHFIEVKAVNVRELDVIHETKAGIRDSDTYRPEDNISLTKLKRLRRVIACYLLENKVGDDIDWHCHAVTVLIDKKRRVGRVNMIKDIII